MDWLSSFVQYIWAMLQWLANFFWALFQYIWQFFVIVANFLWSVLVQVFSWAFRALVSVARFFRGLWDNFFKRIFNAAMRGIRIAHNFLEAKLRPIIDFLKRMRAAYDRWFNLYLKPLLNLIQRVRRVLEVMRFLHINIAKGLDRRLAQIEGKLAGMFLQTRGVLNSLIDFVTSVADPLRIIRRPIILYSIRRVFNGMVRMITGRPPGYFFPSPRAGTRGGLGHVKANFNPNDPTQNPPASAYLPGDDGLGNFQGFVAGQTPSDGAVDDLDALDYFDDSLWPEPMCSDIVSCIVKQRETELARLPGAS